MAKISIDRSSYRVGDELRIKISFSREQENPLGSSNVNVDIFKAKKQRNQLATSFGYNFSPTEETILISRKIPPSFLEGLYFISGCRFIHDDANQPQPLAWENTGDHFFWICSAASNLLTSAELTVEINRADSERSSYTSAKHITELSKETKKPEAYTVLVFGIGCLLHATQQMKGYSIQPLGQGFSYSHMLEAVNKYTQKTRNVILPEVKSIKESFSSATPLFVINFKHVEASNVEDAGTYCNNLAEQIFKILAYERGQKPSSFATVITHLKSKQNWHSFHFLGYKGNLISDFDPSATGERLEKILPKLTSPWPNLIMQLFSESISESNHCHTFLKYWSLLEMVSKKRIKDNSIKLTYPNGESILDHEGNVRRSKSALEKAYQYCIELKLPPSHIHLSSEPNKILFETYEDSTSNPNSDPTTLVIPLWDTLSAFYQIRNSTAHSGRFDITTARSGNSREKLAAKLWALEHGTFLREIGALIKAVVMHELNEP